MIQYEYPFNERTRTFLRLEHLFRRLGALVLREDALDHHFALVTIFEVMEVAARADLKADVLKELERQKQAFNAYRGNPAISESVLDRVIDQIDHCFHELNGLPGKAGQGLTENEWLMNIRARIGIPGGTCEFDLPSYYAWQQGSTASRRADLEHWSSTLGPLAQSLYLLLKILRDSGSPQKMMAIGGQFQLNLPQGRSFHLLRLRLDSVQTAIPEISANRLMVSIRMMSKSTDERLVQLTEDVPFELSLCS